MNKTECKRSKTQSFINRGYRRERERGRERARKGEARRGRE